MTWIKTQNSDESYSVKTGLGMNINSLRDITEEKEEYFTQLDCKVHNFILGRRIYHHKY